MKNDDNYQNELRRQAEKKLRTRHQDPLRVPPHQLHSLIHELEVHQIELEMQNEELRHAQESLEQARDRYMDLYDHAPVGYLTIGSGGLIETANLTAATLFKTDRAALMGQRLSHFVAAEYQDSLYLHHRRLLAEKAPQTFELVMCAGGDRRFYAEVKTVPLSVPIGDVGAYRIIVTDISLRKHIKEERDQLQRERQQWQKWEALGQLAGGVAHEFNNLLGIILGSTELLRNNLGASDLSKNMWYLKHIQKAGDRAAALISKMLAFSRGENDHSKPLQLRSMIRDELDMLRSLLPSSMQIKTELEEQLPDVLLNTDELSQALINLCINAKHAMDETGVLTIRLGWARNIDAECSICRRQIRGDWIALSVADTGCGIDPKIFDKIFEPFFSTKGVGMGSGMGLPVVTGIVRRSGGHIQLESELGKGTTFHLLFPSSSGITPQYQATDEHQEPLSTGQGEHILVVDDEPDLGQLLGEMLKVHGYRATVMASGEQALDLLKENPNKFALVVTDQTMPGMTGIELVRILREIRPGIPIILNTGFSSSVDAEIAAGMGIGYLEKPVTRGRLLRRVEELLRSPPQRNG